MLSNYYRICILKGIKYLNVYLYYRLKFFLGISFSYGANRILASRISMNFTLHGTNYIYMYNFICFFFTLHVFYSV